ncbi:type II toxin-antitoxin system RelE/ParE family toxin [Bradyrhizobium prioriisuperbiae]|uniref:type II toxin-antitoxin system RelE/ParE family toxin n=1 Tax=Bradyrhizobium prioriisuperbiae TaxID=2854389 RepID=UPI0028F0F731|nr:type II toxin-antitoxin system RelE/ParE family toxin [Bradyrhizobium prioritasuperba]
MTHKVEYRDEALADLAALYDYIASESSLEIAIGYIRRIQKACMELATFPERGTKRDDILPGLRTIGFERRATIAFRVFKTRVEIVTIAYGGRNFEQALRQED